MAEPTSNVKKFVPARYLQVTGKNLPALIGSVNEGIESIEQNVQACIDQLFLSTASGKYLINLGEQDGFTLPPNSGLDIRAFRVLVPIMVSSPKQIRITINDLIQAFYGSERTKPNISAEVYGPYSLVSGDDLIVETESGTIEVSILAGQVSNLNSVSPTELSAIINYSQDLLLADTITNRQTGEQALRLTSKTAGTSAYIKVVGGKLQNILRFPKLNDTTIAPSTNWIITKTSPLTDEIRFTWDGTGLNPSIYTVAAGDHLSIRGLVDTSCPLSLLNGSYQLVDTGYDYFIFRNSAYTTLTSTFTQAESNDLTFTKDEKSTLFDLPEYGFSSEVDNQTITVTVPAIPPLTLRFLQGSAHLHGFEAPVLDFTRSTITLQLLPGIDKPVDVNQFLIQNPFFRYDFNKKHYLTYLSDANESSPTYQLETTNPDFVPFPYTIATPIGGTKPIYGTVDSSEYTVTFPNYVHGLQNFWGVTFGGAVAAGGLADGDINQEHQVVQVLDENTIKLRFRNSSGQPIVYEGVDFGPVDVYRQPVAQSDGSDGYLEYTNASALIAAGFSVGDSFKFDPSAGVDISPFYASKLKFGKSVVTSLINTGTVHRVQFSSGIGVGTGGLVISSSEGFRSGFFGGSDITYFLNKNSSINQERVMAGLKTMFINYTPSSNPGYVGSFIYDAEGYDTQFTVSKFVTELTDTVLKGETVAALLVNNLEFGTESFPETGKLIIGYATDKVEGPIRFYSTIDNSGQSQILIDPAYKFKFTHETGASVQFIHAATPYIPKTQGEDYPAYITGTTAAREALFTFIRLLTASGIFVEKDVSFPILTYADSGIQVFD